MLQFIRYGFFQYVTVYYMGIFQYVTIYRIMCLHVTVYHLWVLSVLQFIIYLFFQYVTVYHICVLAMCYSLSHMGSFNALMGFSSSSPSFRYASLWRLSSLVYVVH